MLPDESNDPTVAGFPLEALVADLRGRCKAAEGIYGGPTHYREEVEIFSRYAKERGLELHDAPAELSRQPDAEGNEHQVWFQEHSSTFLKATWPGFFGRLVIQRLDEDSNSSPIEYLERWLLHNQLFGDDIHFLGTISEKGQIRMLIRQPAIAGDPASEEHINEFFTTNGWAPFIVGEETAYFDDVNEVAISDTHPGNLILMKDGLLAPIDLRVQKLSGALLDAVQRLCD